ncbi:MAG TPA: hypothetical protein VFN62_12635 [Acidobacteriaceae bacterium]|nr:hypothetical protein [Acidobacteriaceae bacterium]
MSASPLTSAPTVRNSQTGHGLGVLPARRLWVWWHLLSLDAPTVAVVWCWFFAASFGVYLPATALVTLALGTWCVYVADRLLDGWRSVDMTDLRDRHWFYLRHRKPFVMAWVAAALPLAYLILFRVPPAVRTDDIVLCLIGIGYFLLIHHRSQEDRFSKELFVGFLFSIATAVPTWTRLQEGRTLLLAAMFTFATACWLNCVAIQTWEDAEARRETEQNDFPAGRTRALRVQQNAISRPALTNFLGDHLPAFAMGIGALALSLACLPAARLVWPLFIAVAASSLVFLALMHHNVRLSALSLRVLADGALLTPLLFFLHLR